MATELIAHLVREDGVTPIRFRCDGESCTNLDEFTLEPGSWLDFGGGRVMHAPQIVTSIDD